MSAIFGVLNLDDRPASLEELGRMNAALLADGPDGGNIWVNGPIGLGQRLMRFTPEDSFEHQPLAGCGGQVMLVADARIDNRPELTETFGLDAADAAVLPDSAFIMKAFEKWGRDCMLHLAGELAFAIWDARSKSLFAACSPVGERPFFYHSAPRSVAFSSMPRGLLALPCVPRVLNEDKVADYLARTERGLDTTFYKGILRLRGGHYLTVEPSGLKITRYWNPDFARHIRFNNDDDYVEAFVELFDRVVKDQLRSATPVGVSMSGGLDSSSVGVTAAGQLAERGERLAAYTEVPREGFNLGPGRFYADETPLVEAIARHHSNIDLNLVRTDGEFFLENLTPLFEYAERPFRNTSNRVWMEAIMRTARDQGRRVLLGGYSGNLTVSWNGAGLLPELVRAGKWKRALKEAHAMGGGRSPMGLRLLVTKGFMPLLPKSILVALGRARLDHDAISHFDLNASPIHPHFASAQCLPEHLRENENTCLYEERTGLSTFRRRMIEQIGMAAQLNAGYRAMFGVDARDPTADRRIIEFCLALPEEQCRRNGQTRQLIRRAMKERLPAEVLENRGRGRQAADWLERLTAAEALIAAELDRMERSEAARSMLDIARLRRLFAERHAEGRDEDRTRLQLQTTLEAGLMMGAFLRWFETGQST